MSTRTGGDRDDVMNEEPQDYDKIVAIKNYGDYNRYPGEYETQGRDEVVLRRQSKDL
jgi:hypothetical protein